MAGHSKERHLNDLKADDKRQVVFWTAGNEPTQQVYGLTRENVRRHLKLLYLLSDTIVASASYYFESPVTREVTQLLKSLFEDGSVLYFIDDDLEDVVDHAKKKMAKSPKGMREYSNRKEVLEKAKEIEHIGQLVKRPNISISNRIVELWIKDVLSSEPSSIGSWIGGIAKNPEEAAVSRQKLIDFARQREKDFVWKYIEPFLNSLGLKNEGFHKKVREKLVQMYARATAQVLGVEVEETADYTNIHAKSRFDTSLFGACLNQVGILEDILNLENNDLKVLKNTTEFALFRDFYFRLIDDVAYDSENSVKSISMFDKFGELYKTATNREELVGKYKQFQNLSHYPTRKFRKKIDEIRDIIQAFNEPVIGSLRKYVKNRGIVKANEREAARKAALKNDYVENGLKKYAANAKRCILWYVLFIFIGAVLFLAVNLCRDLPVVKELPYNNGIFVGLSMLLALGFPSVRSFIKHDSVRRALHFCFLKAEKAKVKKELEKKFDADYGYEEK